MEFDYDVLIIGGAFSGAATGVMIKRNHPGARVLIIEKNAALPSCLLNCGATAPVAI